MRSASKSDPGLVRENNEDYVLADPANGIFLLADGMGGEPAGEVASELAVTAAHELLMRQLDAGATADTGQLLANALAAAHSAVAKHALGDPSLAGMGTTLEIVVVRGTKTILCHVGDSRVYLFRRGALRQLTTDDNYAVLVAPTGTSPAGRARLRFRHVLTQAVGVSQELVPQVGALEMEPGDLLLLCSDGLNEALDDAEIATLMGQSPAELDAISEALVKAANEKGGPDNVSVVVVEPIPGYPQGARPDRAAPRKLLH